MEELGYEEHRAKTTRFWRNLVLKERGAMYVGNERLPAEGDEEDNKVPF